MIFMPKTKIKKIYIIFFAVFAFGIVLGAAVTSIFSKTPVDINENQISLLNDREYFDSVDNLLSQAKRSIHMVMFDISYYPDYPDSLVNSLLSDLKEAASRGVDVKVITDEYLTERPVVRILEESGINIKFDSKAITTHPKLIIIDSQIVIIGSTNWSYHSIEKNHEANVIIHSIPLARQFEGYFQSIWMES